MEMSCQYERGVLGIYTIHSLLKTVKFSPGRHAISISSCTCCCAGIAAFVVAFFAVIVGWALSLDYSAKLFTMTFVLVIMGSERASGVHAAYVQILHCCSMMCICLCQWK